MDVVLAKFIVVGFWFNSVMVSVAMIAEPLSGAVGWAPSVIVAVVGPISAADNTTGSPVDGVKLCMVITDESYVRSSLAAETVAVLVFMVTPRENVCPVAPVAPAGVIASVGPVDSALFRSSIRWVSTAHTKTGSNTKSAITPRSFKDNFTYLS